MAALTGRLRVASWNVHEGLQARGDFRGRATRKEIADLLLRAEVDVVGLQEVDLDADGRSHVLDAIQDGTPLAHIEYYILSESSFSSTGRAGVALASRFPLKNQRRDPFPNPGLRTLLDGGHAHTHDKGMVSAALRLPGEEVSVVSLHGFPFYLFDRSADEPDFRGIWSALAADLASLAVSPLIVCGDFNTERRDLVLAHAKLSLTRSMTDKPTYLESSFDDVLYSSEFQLASACTVENFSDHRLCIVELVQRR